MLYGVVPKDRCAIVHVLLSIVDERADAGHMGHRLTLSFGYNRLFLNIEYKL